MKKHQGLSLAALLCLCCLVMFAGACATMQARKAETTGFLGDYSQLQKGGEDEALLRYIAPDANIKAYDRIVMDPVQLYGTAEDSLADISKEDRQSIVNYVAVAIREQLGKDYTFVDGPGEGVMRLRVAITEAEGANVALDTVSTILPIGLALSGLQQLATGSPGFVGEAGVEAEMLDSRTGRRLFAAVDRRVGGKVTGEFDKLDKWRTVQSAFDYWAEKLRKRLAEERAK